MQFWYGIWKRKRDWSRWDTDGVPEDICPHSTLKKISKLFFSKNYMYGSKLSSFNTVFFNVWNMNYDAEATGIRSINKLFNYKSPTSAWIYPCFCLVVFKQNQMFSLQPNPINRANSDRILDTKNTKFKQAQKRGIFHINYRSALHIPTITFINANHNEDKRKNIQCPTT